MQAVAWRPKFVDAALAIAVTINRLFTDWGGLRIIGRSRHIIHYLSVRRMVVTCWYAARTAQ